jgi:inner membrane transporter RhtA
VEAENRHLEGSGGRDRVVARLSGAPAPALFVIGAVSQYLGAALAVSLFDDVPAVGVAWWRVVGAALALWIWVRPWRRRWNRRDVVSAGAFGVVLAAMNLTFYAAIDRLPLGTAVAIEFLGPITVAAVGTRTRRDFGALALAIGGVALLTDVQWRDDDGFGGVALALLSGALWAGYIVLGRRVATSGEVDGLAGLAVGTAVGAVVWSPLGLHEGWPAFDPPVLVLLCAVVGVLSNALPYGLDQLVLPRLTASQFALLLALLPATATVIGVIALAQVPNPAEAIGIALVVAAVAVRTPESPAPADAAAT